MSDLFFIVFPFDCKNPQAKKVYFVDACEEDLYEHITRGKQETPPVFSSTWVSKTSKTDQL